MTSFDELAAGWVAAAAADFGYPPPSPDFGDALADRLPAGLRQAVADGVERGAIVPVEGHRFTVVGLAPGKGPYALFSKSKREVPAPNWEYFVQAAEYARLHRLLEGSGLVLGFEDGLMDISVRRDGEVVWCIEVKEKATDLDRLATDVASHADGIDTERPDRHDDGLRKAKYLLEFRPAWLSLVAIGRRHDYEVTYPADGRFRLRPDLVPLG
jgi:hypothetical protein